ncbi:MAG: thioredoxin family protein [bacterium]|nr:thioredoxin family protein [bacterium]
MVDGKKYLVAFLITALIFATAVFVSSVLSDKKLEDVKAIENRVALDILSSETQFALLEETSCKDIKPGFLSKELGTLGEKLAYVENQSGFNSGEVWSLKRSYFLLEIKDYLLMKRLTEKCGIKPTFILYFYSDEDRCKDCEKMGYVLTALRDKYPDLRVYSFDYDFDVEAIRTLTSIYKIEPNLPALFIDGTVHYGYRPLEQLEEDVPSLKRLKLEAEEASATTTEER